MIDGETEKNEICEFCNTKFKHGISANMIIICPNCKKTTKIICDYGFGGIIPCDIYFGNKIVGTIEDADILVSREYNLRIKLEREHKNLQIYSEAIEIIQQYLKSF